MVTEASKPGHLTITEASLDRLLSARVWLRPRFHSGNALGRSVRIGNRVTVEQYARIPEGSLNWGRDVVIGAFSYVSPGSALPEVHIGRFCSIATNVSVMGADHPINRVTTSTWTYGHNVAAIVRQDFGISPIQDRNPPKASGLTIGDDCWIGEGVVLRPGIMLGTGCIVGSRAVVTRDVPAYAIVAGNPARVVRYRFDEPVRDALTASQWWRRSPAVLASLPMHDVGATLAQLGQPGAEDTDWDYPVFDLAELIGGSASPL